MLEDHPRVADPLCSANSQPSVFPTRVQHGVEVRIDLFGTTAPDNSIYYISLGLRLIFGPQTSKTIANEDRITVRVYRAIALILMAETHS